MTGTSSTRLLATSIFCHLLFHLVLAIHPINKQYDDANPEGLAGVDYPIYRTVPRGLPFNCVNRNAGFYADPDTSCQVWHLCDPFGRRHSFLCPNRTMFNQLIRGCDWWYNVDCEASEDLYSNNIDLFKRTQLAGPLPINHNNNFGSRPAPSPPRVSSEESVNSLDIPNDRRPPHRVITAPPPPPPPRPAPPSHPKTQRPLIPFEQVRPATFKVIRRPVTTPAPFIDFSDETKEQTERPRPPQRPPQQYRPHQQDLPAPVPFTEGPPRSWTVHFIAGNVLPNARPSAADQGWRLAADQERSFPHSGAQAVPTEPPNSIASFPSTTRAPHIISTSAPHEAFSSTQRSRPPASSTQFPVTSRSDFGGLSSTVHSVPQNRISTLAPFGSRTSPEFEPVTGTLQPFSNVNIPISEEFSPDDSNLESVPEVDNFQPDFGIRQPSQAPEISVSVEHPSTRGSLIQPARWPSTVRTADTFRPFTITTPAHPHIPSHTDSWWSTHQDDPQVNNFVDQTELSANLPPEFPQENQFNFPSTAVQQETQRTRVSPFINTEITTYHPKNVIQESSSSSAFAQRINEVVSTSHAPIVRTTRRRVVKTTTEPATIPTTITTTTPRPRGTSPPKEARAHKAAPTEELIHEPSIPLVFGTRLKPKKTFRLDNEASGSEIHLSTVRSTAQEESPSTSKPDGSLYELPVVVNTATQ